MQKYANLKALDKEIQGSVFDAVFFDEKVRFSSIFQQNFVEIHVIDFSLKRSEVDSLLYYNVGTVGRLCGLSLLWRSNYLFILEKVRLFWALVIIVTLEFSN